MGTVTVIEYETRSGIQPYSRWLDDLGDHKGRGIIESRLNRIRRGLFGNVRSLGGALYELKIEYGPGYRIYYVSDGPAVVILLCGGDKSTQSRDIAKAREYANDYWGRKV